METRMATKVLRPPTKEILDAADAIEKGIGKFLAAKENFKTELFFEYESSRDGFVQLVYMIRSIDSVLALSRTDLILIPGALTISRTVLEITIKTLWMLDADDPFAREARWLRLTSDSEKFWKSQRDETPYPDVKKHANIMLIAAQNFFGEVRQELNKRVPSTHDSTKQVPKIKEMTNEIKAPDKYLSYRELSQYTHGTQLGTGLYHTGYGRGQQFGEFVTAQDWFIPLWVCWKNFYDTAKRWLTLVGVNPDEFATDLYYRTVEIIIQKIENPPGSLYLVGK